MPLLNEGLLYVPAHSKAISRWLTYTAEGYTPIIASIDRVISRFTNIQRKSLPGILMTRGIIIRQHIHKRQYEIKEI